MSEDDKSLIKDTLNTTGWKLVEEMNKKVIEGYRLLATTKDIKLEDRLWYSALAQGREEALEEPRQKVV